MVLVNCYNKGCGQKYDPESNNSDSCIHHPGVPVFHDALKGWSCCKKRSTDFTEFLNIPGCTTGTHSNDKPAEPAKPSTDETAQEAPAPPPQRTPLEKKVVMERPPVNTPKVELKKTIGATLTQALEKQMASMTVTDTATNGEAVDDTQVKVGTSCKNNSCKAEYRDESSLTENCLYHPGVPIFHEGMKYWTCCNRKTSDFDVFLNQEGCESGRHLWVKKEDPGKKVACRQDWHQTGNNVIISVFSKVAIPDQSWVRVNPVAVTAHIVFDGGKSVFEKDMVLHGIIDPGRSSVKMVGTKVEITLRKAEPGSWPSLERKHTDTPTDAH